jgi:8-amino-7-oxononanoate synthase
MMEVLAARLQKYRDQGLYRCRQFSQDSSSIAFNSNDYLGLAGHPQVAEALASAAKKYGCGSTGSHLISGHHHEHQALEEELAEFVGRPRALLFSSGYMANLGVMQALLGRHDTVVSDRLNHASLIDAAKLSGARHRRYRHADVASADENLQAAGGGQKLLVTDGVFSMDGDIAPLPELAAVAEQRAACLMVDDAHGFGVLGNRGSGSVQAAGLSMDQVPVLMATLGKAAGIQGAFVAGSETLVEGLIQFARTYVYTTALPAAVAAALRVSLRLIREDDWRRDQLKTNVNYFRNAAGQLGLQLLPSTTAIQGVVAGDNYKAMGWARQLQLDGIGVTAIRAPTVPTGGERLRITLSAGHATAEIDQLVEGLARLQTRESEVSHGR